MGICSGIWQSTKGFTLTMREQARVQTLSAAMERRASPTCVRDTESNGRVPPPSRREWRWPRAAAGFNHLHMTEALVKPEGLRSARSILRRALLAGCVSKTRGRGWATRYPNRECHPKGEILL